MKKISQILACLLLFFVSNRLSAQQSIEPCGTSSHFDTALIHSLPWFGNNAWLKSYTDSIVRARSLLYLPPPPPTSVERVVAAPAR